MGPRSRAPSGLGAILIAALALGVALGVAACGPATTPAPTTATDTPAPSVDASAPTSTDDSGSSPSNVVPDSPIAGVVTGVDTGIGTAITGFTIKTNLGETYHFTIGQLQNADEFPPSNLRDSMDAQSPVLVFFDIVNGNLVVNRIEDAG